MRPVRYLTCTNAYASRGDRTDGGYAVSGFVSWTSVSVLLSTCGVVDPDIHVVAVGEIPLPELAILLVPHRREARDVGGTQAGRVLAEQHRQRFAKVAGRQPPQIEDGQHLGDPR